MKTAWVLEKQKSVNDINAVLAAQIEEENAKVIADYNPDVINLDLSNAISLMEAKIEATIDSMKNISSDETVTLLQQEVYKLFCNNAKDIMQANPNEKYKIKKITYDNIGAPILTEDKSNVLKFLKATINDREPVTI